MSEFISTFTTGFDSVVEEQIVRDLPGAKVIKVYDGLLHYYFKGNYNIIENIVYLNNTFCVMKVFEGGHLNFDNMVIQSSKERHKFLISNGSCRIRFSKKNQFAKVNKNTIRVAEEHVTHNSALRIDRLSPKTEIWYMIRSEGVGFYCQLLFKRGTTEKKLSRGELRPEFAYLMCKCAALTKESIVCDPFCGYGAIPKQLITNCKIKKVLASDIDQKRIVQLRETNWADQSKVELRVADAANLREIPDHSVNAIITDPPWGYYEDIGDIEKLYTQMLSEFLRIVKRDGTMVVLSAKKEEFINACKNNHINHIKQLNTLVNGKKASVFIILK